MHLDQTAAALISEAGPDPVRLVANEPDARDAAEYRDKTIEEVAHHHIPDPDRIAFLEITVTDPSEFETELHIRERIGTAPHIYFDWTEGNPVLHLLRYLLSGAGEIAPVTGEILRRSDPFPKRRPVVHVA